MTPKAEGSDRAATYQVKVLDRAIDILDAFTLRRTDLNLREIVEATGLNRSTATRLVSNLERRGLLQQVPSTGRYRLGVRLFEMGSQVYSSLSLVEAAAKPLAALEQRSGTTIILAIQNGEHCVTVDRRQGIGDGFAMVPMPSEVGTVRPLNYGPVGQVFLSRLAPEVVDELMDKYPLERYTPYSVTDRELFLERLPLVRSRGYAIEVNEVVEGLMGLAAPIFDFAGDTAGVLSLGFPATRENDAGFLDAALRDLLQAAAEVSTNMGYAADSGDAPPSAEDEDQTDQSEAIES
jgi:IclR family transcriptional regulator, KDG regulon repressor